MWEAAAAASLTSQSTLPLLLFQNGLSSVLARPGEVCLSWWRSSHLLFAFFGLDQSGEVQRGTVLDSIGCQQESCDCRSCQRSRGFFSGGVGGRALDAASAINEDGHLKCMLNGGSLDECVDHVQEVQEA